MEEVLYRLDPRLIIYPTRLDGRRSWIAETSSSEPPLLILDAIFLWAISALPENFTITDAIKSWSTDESAVVRSAEIWDVLLSQKLVVRSDETNSMMLRAKLWQQYGWDEAFAYQEATRSFPFVQMNEPTGFDIDTQRMKRYYDETNPPSPYLTTHSKKRLALRRWYGDPELESILASFDDFQRRGLDGISVILDYCAGERASFQTAFQGKLLLKSVPSGGARHPTEVYLFTFENFLDAKPGVYHYNVEHHALDLITSGDFRGRTKTATFDLFDKFDRPPFGLLVFTSRVSRAMWRYRDDRSARAPLVDIGHALMAYRTAARAIGVNYYTYQKFRDSDISGLLQVSKIEQPPLFVGTLV